MEENKNFQLHLERCQIKLCIWFQNHFKRRIYYVNYPFDIFKKLFVFFAVEAKEVGRTRQRKFFEGFGKWKKEFRL
jgi:hypothetical protein